jgi:hypothetical protein
LSLGTTKQNVDTTKGEDVACLDRYGHRCVEYRITKEGRAKLVFAFRVHAKNVDISALTLEVMFMCELVDFVSYTLVSPIKSASSVYQQGLTVGLLGFPTPGIHPFITFSGLSQEPSIPRQFNQMHSVNKLHHSPLLLTGKPVHFSIVDTSEYLFDTKIQHDKELLEKLIQGLGEGTILSKKVESQSLIKDPKNALTHIILTIAARDIYRFWYRITFYLNLF